MVEHNCGMTVQCKWFKHGQGDLQWEMIEWNGINRLQCEVGKVGHNDDKFGITLQ